MKHERLGELLDGLDLRDGMCVSFHHHLRNGDKTLNLVMQALHERGLKELHLMASALFPVHKPILPLIKDGTIADITTNYMNGPIAECLSNHGLKGSLTMQTHGGRARSIVEGDNVIDVAFIAAPAVDKAKNASGVHGKNACGSLGYAIEDSLYAKRKVLVTDNLVDTLEDPQIQGDAIDDVLLVKTLGDAEGIMSGTLKITKDPLGLKIAREALRLLQALDVFEDGVSFQSGAGGISLAITKGFNDIMRERGLKASFYSGGITRYHVDALEGGLVDKLYDVQCFDDAAIESLKKNANHHAISASNYANPNNANRVIKDLDVVILGASEIDTDFNVNVTTDSYGTIIGGSGGHSDTAEDAKLSVIVSPLLKARTPLIRERVRTITTPGKHIDCLITERGIAINPKRRDLLEKLKDTRLPLFSIEELMAKAHAFTGKPKVSHPGDKIGVVESRHGSTLDNLYKKGD